MPASMAELVEQHVRASESRLRHIDELMAKARETATGVERTDVESLLQRIQLERDRLAAELDDLRRGRRLPPGGDGAERAQGLSGALHRVGAQLEHALAAVLEGR